MDTVVDGVDLYEDQDEDSDYEAQDAVSLGLGAEGYLANPVVDACQEKLGEGVWREPERFDRQYWQPERVLVDVVPDTDDTDRPGALADKHVEFKAKWCADNGYIYLVLSESDSYDAERVAEAYADAAQPPTSAAPAAQRAKGKPKAKVTRPRKARARKASKVQRPAA